MTPGDFDKCSSGPCNGCHAYPVRSRGGGGDRADRRRGDESDRAAAVLPAGPHHPSLMLASRTTLLHFSISALTKLRNSSGVFSRNSTLRDVSRSITSRWRSTALRLVLSLVMIGAGVPLGTNTPFHS